MYSLRSCCGCLLRTGARQRRYLNTDQLEPLIGSQQLINSKKSEYEEKYRARLEKVAKEKGVALDQLKQEAMQKSKLQAKMALQSKSNNRAAETPKPADLHQVKAGSLKKEAVSQSPMKSLSSILDVDKLLSRTPAATKEEIAALWATYHASSKSKTKLGAVVPLASYQKMYALSRKFPEFVLALPRESPEGVKGAEIIFLQWAALPTSSQSSFGQQHQPTSVLFTSLAAYKSHGTFAQPALCVTHYTDFSSSHELVLLRGEITTSDASGQPLMSTTDAQLLLYRLQQYYGSQTGTEQRQQLESFHGKSDKAFDVDALANKAWELT